MKGEYIFESYVGPSYTEAESQYRTELLLNDSRNRRSIRNFSSREVPITLVEQLLKVACTAPSGANKQPWTFCAVRNSDLKRSIRIAAEQEEFESYHHRMGEEWLHDLKPFGTDWNKPFLEVAPWLIIVFKRPYEVVDGKKWQNYYVNESVGIACGMLIHAIHHAGLATLTHTPSPMNFLHKILNRPENERPYLLMPLGYPAEDAMVPVIDKKAFDDVTTFYM